MGAFSSRVSRRAFSGPLLKHGRRLRPLSFPVNETKGTEEGKMGIIKKIILLPFLPIKWAWKWSAGAKINGQENGFAHFIGFLILAAALYSMIGWGVRSIVDMFTK
jgi:hypothetical protein